MLYSLVVDWRVESGVIDVLYLREGDWTIVGLKTGKVWDEAALKGLLATKDLRCAAWWEKRNGPL